MPCPDFDTSRLSVRNWAGLWGVQEEQQRIARRLRAILTPPVLCHLPETVQLSGPEDSAIADWMARRFANGTVFNVTRRSDGVLIGLLTLAQPDPLDLRLGYLLAEDAWGQGFASELVTGFLQALAPCPGRIIHGGVVPENAASARVLIKAGFLHDAAQSSDDLDMYVLRG